MKMGIRAMAGNLATNLSGSHNLKPLVDNNDNTANKNWGRNSSEEKITGPSGLRPATNPTNKNPLANRLDRLVRKTNQKLRCPKPDAGWFGIVFRGPTRRKFVSPYPALRTDVVNATIPIGFTSGCHSFGFHPF